MWICGGDSVWLQTAFLLAHAIILVHFNYRLDVFSRSGARNLKRSAVEVTQCFPTKEEQILDYSLRGSLISKVISGLSEDDFKSNSTPQ
jgi:hypothetical protein